MSKKLPITIVSSFSDDILLTNSGKYLGVRDGGPALFITKALADEAVEYNLFSGEKLTTEIKITDVNEFGKLKSIPSSSNAGELSLNNWTLVSTVCDEWDISQISGVEYLFVDVQGFVREGRSFGRKKAWPKIAELSNSIYGLKGTKEELDCLPKKVINEQKNRLLVITLGRYGAEIYWRRKKYTIKAEYITDLSDTIGAGDTFFAYFVAGLYRGLSPGDAAKKASNKTANFLRGKNVPRV